MLFGKRIAGLMVVALTAAYCGCKPASSPPPTVPAATNQAQIKKFPTRGVIEEVQGTNSSLVVKHEKIPDYMEAMTMTFEVRPAGQMAGLKPGDIISFTLVDAGRDGWIEEVKRVGSTNLPVTPRPETFRQVRNVEPLKVGDLVPDYPFTNELGQAVSLGQYRGQALALTFIFTRCPFPTFCPRMSENLAESYRKLSAMSSGPTNWHLLSLSFDPEFDTPAVLKNYASRYKYDPKRWNFVTGALIEIDALTEQLGLTFFRDPNGIINHNLRTAVIDARGRLHKVYIGNEWKVDDFVADMAAAAGVK
jgi:protein SCO1/2